MESEIIQIYSEEQSLKEGICCSQWRAERKRWGVSVLRRPPGVYIRAEHLIKKRETESNCRVRHKTGVDGIINIMRSQEEALKDN